MSNRDRNKKRDRKRSVGRPAKRQFSGNIHTRKQNDPEPGPSGVSASARKVSASELPESAESFSGYRIVDRDQVFDSVVARLRCDECNGVVCMKEIGLRGQEAQWQVVCSSCGPLNDFKTSKSVGAKKNAPEVNRRIVFAIRNLGQGLSGLKTFCGLMDLPPPSTQRSYDSMVEVSRNAAKSVATISMKRAAEEERNETFHDDGNPSTQLTVSGDGSWHTRGFGSLHGQVSLIGSNTGKVLDVEVLSKYCPACERWKNNQDTPEYEEFVETHKDNCSANYSGSAGGMEPAGIQAIFARSQENYGVQYAFYIGDGDTKTFSSLKALNPYPNITIQKIECTGHVQKRMGGRLRKLKKQLGKKVLSDGKTIGGKNRLTDNVVLTLSVHYGSAIRSNKGSVQAMYRAIWATYFHKISTDDDPQHYFCPEGTSSWCAWQRAAADDTTEDFSHKNTLPAAVMEEIKPIYVDLSKIELLERCLGAKTQNPNESFNNLVWKICPKEYYNGLKVVELSIYLAVGLFNDGCSSRIKILQEMGITAGQYAKTWAREEDRLRIRKAEVKAQAATLEARKAKRAKQVAEHQETGKHYAAGLGD